MDSTPQSHHDSLVARLEEAEKRISQHESSVQEWKTKYEKADEELGELGMRIATETMARAEAEANLDAAKSARPDTTEIDAVRAKLATLEKESAEDKARIRDLENDAKTAEKAAAATRQEAAAAKQRAVADVDDVRAKLSDDVGVMQKKLDAAHALNDELEAQLAEAKTKVAERESVEAEYKAQLQARDAELKAAKVRG